MAREVIRVISLYDKVERPESITLKSKWHEIGRVNVMKGSMRLIM